MLNKVRKAGGLMTSGKSVGREAGKAMKNWKMLPEMTAGRGQTRVKLEDTRRGKQTLCRNAGKGKAGKASLTIE